MSDLQVFKILEEMRLRRVQPSAVTYGCVLSACEATADADLAFRVYKEACADGVLPTDECHNALIRVCATAGRVDEALEEIKLLMRKHGDMQLHTINSLTRALCEPFIGALCYNPLHDFLCCV